jgi:16S rRNA (cytidine1402-2'-O)-methyltransferase
MPQTTETSRRYSIGAAVFEAEKRRPGLYVTATPIGNLRDITIRALETLAGVDRVLCEDTRIASKLLDRYGIRNKLSPYHEHNAQKVRPGILADLKDGAAIALVSDAGMPLVSDPGYKLVAEAAGIGIHVEAIPGASATLMSLALSGLPTDRFLFSGFLSHKTGERQAALAELKNMRASLIFFESPNRIVDTLRAIAEVMGDRAVAVTRELTKLHEEVVRGSASEVAVALAARPSIKGEITLVVGPPDLSIAEASVDEIDAALKEATQSLSAGQAAARVARQLGIPKKHAYARLLSLKNERSDG